jgi:hypothetical protein
MAAKLAPLAGLAAVVVIVVAVIVGGEPPGADEGAAEIVEFYSDEGDSQQLASALLAWGTLLFLVFLSTLWTTLRAAQTERRASSTLALIGGVVFAVGLTIFSSIGFVLGDLHDELPPAAVQALNAMNEDFFFTSAVGGAGFYFGAGAAIVQTGALPKWLGWVAIVLGVVSITPAGFIAFLAIGIWLIIASIILAMRAGGEPAQREPGAAN